ncbi:restriction endonuclease subunit S [Aminipila butyrica]|uniref:Restriction endonuclease subunit S n=1 Tax=Aminipila butyrica TaxID=433296 RepID=A0A858BWR1_9FIRM|nr:restriction endonuclease subunit S [Aminipila butyrica]QIB70373.1 restriction endonuclease subunit S [Aminipila butyrica]
MSRLRILIQELCPQGVDMVELGDVMVCEPSETCMVESKEYQDEFFTPVLEAGTSFILGYTGEKTGVFQASPAEPVVLFDDNSGAFRWVEFNFKVESPAMKLLTAKDKAMADFRYLYYMMKRIERRGDEKSNLWAGYYSKMGIPLPSLPIQHEIVKILDNIAEEEENLSLELAARKKQYEHYRQLLLTFHEAADNISKQTDGL